MKTCIILLILALFFIQSAHSNKANRWAKNIYKPTTMTTLDSLQGTWLSVPDSLQAKNDSSSTIKISHDTLSSFYGKTLIDQEICIWAILAIKI